MGLSLGQKAGWGLADMGIVVFVIVKQLLVLAYLTSYLGVPIDIAGLVTTGVLVFDIITDPIVGYISDKTQSRWGRRAPWMFIGALLMVGGIIGLFSVPSGANTTIAIAWVTGFFGLATIGFTMVAIPYGATAGEMTQNPQERSVMTGWRMGFASVGILVGGALIPKLASDMGHAMAAVYVSPLIVGAIWLSLFFTRKAPRIHQPSSMGFVAIVKLVLSNRSFSILTVSYGIMTFAVALITAGLPFAALYLIMDNGMTMLSGAAGALTVLSLMFAAFVVGSILSQAVWVLVSAKLGKLGALVLGLSLYILLLLALHQVMPSVNVTTMAGMFVLAGMANGAYQQIPWAMYPDLMDITRQKTGQAIEGAFSAIWLFGQKVANAFAPMCLALILGANGWQETTQGKVDQSDAAVTALQASITLIPAAVLLLAIVTLVFVYRPSLGRAAMDNSSD
ncbi:MAG: MFS transporter [Gammaproteobacteria bacterium]|nr:MFS transporter [Gammaproteobacteria bacterium]MDP6165607.1 MFS transporter [Gammaproteobacteria bacterium]